MNTITFSRNRLSYLLKKHAKDVSLRQMSLRMGVKENYLSNLLKSDATDHSKGGPRLLPMVRLAQELKITTDELAGRPDVEHLEIASTISEDAALGRMANVRASARYKPHEAPSLQTMLCVYHSSGGQHEAFEQYSDFFDLYSPPADEHDEISAVHVGQYSMAGITMGTTSPATLSNALNLSSDKLRLSILRSHLECMERGPVVTIETLNEKMANKPIAVRLNYSRLVMHVAKDNGAGWILTYAVPMF